MHSEVDAVEWTDTDRIHTGVDASERRETDTRRVGVVNARTTQALCAT